MGDWADSVLDGEYCEGCGKDLDDAPGYPQRCETCEAAGGEDEPFDFDDSVRVAAIMKEVQQLDALGLDHFLSELRAWLVTPVIVHSEDGQPIALHPTIDPTPYRRPGPA